MPTLQETLRTRLTRHKNLTPVLICLALVILTMTAFWQLKDCGFINFDDNEYVYENTHIQSGLNRDSIGYAFSFDLGNWHPLTFLSHILIFQLFGLNPQAHHLINLLFHVINAVLLFLVLRRMTRAIWPSAFVAALFAIHPLHVESVAWIAERKDVLSAFFWLLTMGAYSYYVESPGFRRYLFVLLFFVIGLMAKSMLVTLPFVLLLLDYWPLGRFQEIQIEHKVHIETVKSGTSENQNKPSKRKQAVIKISEGAKKDELKRKWSLIYPIILEKVPLFALSIVSCILTYLSSLKGGAVQSVGAVPVSFRIENAFVSYISYIRKMIWPNDLAIFYPYPKLMITWQVLVAVLLLIAVTGLVIWRSKKSPYLFTGWFWYIGTLVPVIGILQVGAQAMADRYTYLPLVGIFFMVAWGVPELLKKWPHRTKILPICCILCILCLSVVTWSQVGFWRNNFTLYQHALNVTHDNWLVLMNRGSAYAVIKNYKQAIEDFNRAIEINPLYAEAYNNRGNAYTDLDHHKKAIEDFNRAIDIKPSFAGTYGNRGNAYIALGNTEQAIEDFSRAIAIKPDDVSFYIQRGVVYLNKGDSASGCRDAQKACELGNCKLLKDATKRGSCR